MSERKRGIICAYCGMAWGYDDESPTPELIKVACDHESICEKNPYTAQIRNLKQERDEAREKLENEMKWHHRTHTELVQTQCKILDMQINRDEIQEKYDNLASEHMLVVNKLCEERDEAREQVNRYRYNLDLLPIKWDI